MRWPVYIYRIRSWHSRPDGMDGSGVNREEDRSAKDVGVYVLQVLYVSKPTEKIPAATLDGGLAEM